MIGTCALCLKQAELRDSHLVPQALYKRALDRSRTSPHPVLYSASGERQTSKQARKHLLCSDCEQRFHRNGEDWMLDHAATSPTEFRLRDILLKQEAYKAADDIWYFQTKGVGEINADALGYFTLSVIWRASVCDWPIGDRIVPRLELGPYAELLRRYLLSETDLPDEVAVTVYACSAAEVHMTTNMPHSEKQSGYHNHLLDIPGLSFDVSIGSRLPEHIRASCIFRNDRPIFYTQLVQLLNARDYALLRQSMPKKGRLGM